MSLNLDQSPDLLYFFNGIALFEEIRLSVCCMFLICLTVSPWCRLASIDFASETIITYADPS